MKKLRLWQLLLLIIFFPVGIIYLFVWSVKQLTSTVSKSSADNIQPNKSKELMVFIFPGSKVYHNSLNCPFASRQNTKSIPLSVAKSRGLKQCKKCLNSNW